jgi:hypothetical protein
MFLVAFPVAKFCVLLSSSQSIIISSSLQAFQGTHLPPINNPLGEGGGENRALDEPAPALVPWGKTPKSSWAKSGSPSSILTMLSMNYIANKRAR